MKHHVLKFAYACIVLISISCGTKRNPVSQEIKPVDSSKLLFINYVIEANEDGKRAKVLNQIITDGRLKRHHKKITNNPTTGDFKCTQLNKKSSEVTAVYIKNPLVSIIETVNDSLGFTLQKIEQRRATLSLKLQLHPDTKSIALSHVIDSLNNVVELIKSPI